MPLVRLAITTIDAVAVLTTKYLQMEALTIHFKALGFATVAAHLLNLGYFLVLFSLTCLRGYWGYDCWDLKTFNGFLFHGLLDVHYVLPIIFYKAG